MLPETISKPLDCSCTDLAFAGSFGDCTRWLLGCDQSLCCLSSEVCGTASMAGSIFGSDKV